MSEIRTHPANEAYRAGFDRVFSKGKKGKEARQRQGLPEKKARGKSS